MSSRITRKQGKFIPGFYKKLHQGTHSFIQGTIGKKINKKISKTKNYDLPNKMFEEILAAMNYNIANLLKSRRPSSPVRVFQLFITKQLVKFFKGLGLNNRFKQSNDFLTNNKLITCRFFNVEDYSEIVDNSFKLKISTKKTLCILNRDLTEEKLQYPSKLCCKFTVKKKVKLI